jgi:histidinol dehydrogenase
MARHLKHGHDAVSRAEDQAKVRATVDAIGCYIPGGKYPLLALARPSLGGRR